MRVHFVVHESFESAGAYLKWAEDRGYTISWSRVYAGEALPPNADEFDMLVVFGGPQSPRTTREEYPYFDSRAEQHLINQAISARHLSWFTAHWRGAGRRCVPKSGKRDWSLPYYAH